MLFWLFLVDDETDGLAVKATATFKTRKRRDNQRDATPGMTSLKDTAMDPVPVMLVMPRRKSVGRPLMLHVPWFR